VDGAMPIGRPKKTWRKIAEKDCLVHGLNREDAMDCISTQPFYGSVDFVRDNPGEPVPEGTFRHLLDFLEPNEDNTSRCTNNLDGLPPHPD